MVEKKKGRVGIYLLQRPYELVSVVMDEDITVAMVMNETHYCCPLIGLTFDDILPRESILNASSDWTKV